MDILTLDVQSRATDKKPINLRREGYVPAIYYGMKKKNIDLMIDYQQFRKIYKMAGTNTILELVIDGKDKKTVLIHDIQYHPVSDQYTHVDFVHVDLKKEVTTEVPLEFIGESAAVRQLGGTLTTNRTEVEIKCLAQDIPKVIKVDISPLEDFKCSIHMRDLILPEGVQLLEDEGVTVATVSAPRAEEEPLVTEEEAAEGEEKEEGEEKDEATEKEEKE